MLDSHGRAVTETIQFAVYLGLALAALYLGHVQAWGAV